MVILFAFKMKGAKSARFFWPVADLAGSLDLISSNDTYRSNVNIFSKGASWARNSPSVIHTRQHRQHELPQKSQQVRIYWK